MDYKDSMHDRDLWWKLFCSPTPEEGQPRWSAYRQPAFGQGVLTFINETTAHWQWNRHALANLSLHSALITTHLLALQLQQELSRTKFEEWDVCLTWYQQRKIVTDSFLGARSKVTSNLTRFILMLQGSWCFRDKLSRWCLHHQRQDLLQLCWQRPCLGSPPWPQCCQLCQHLSAKYLCPSSRSFRLDFLCLRLGALWPKHIELQSSHIIQSDS